MQNKIKFSIVIPTYNEENYLGIILDALEKQTLKPAEVIIVDCFSEDKTEEVALSFKNTLPITFIKTTNKGPGNQRNEGAKLAKYENLMFFDADTKIKPNFLETYSTHLKKYDFDAGTVWNYAISNKLLDKIGFIFYSIVVLTLGNLIGTYGNGAFIYIKKDLFNKLGGFDDTVVHAEDFDLFKRIGQSGAKCKIFSNPQIYISMRRFEKEGRLKTLYILMKGTVYFLLRGSMRKKIVEYEFGNF